MNIVRLILQNLRKGTVSYKLPHRHQCTSEHYRGLIENDASRCIGCGACAYVCPTGAIQVKRSGDTYTWDYDPGKCTFCERCIERCRPNTLSSQSKLPPLYSHQGELAVHYEMQKKKPAPRPTAAAASSPTAAVAVAAGVSNSTAGAALVGATPAAVATATAAAATLAADATAAAAPAL
jgi:formate hydrogenlyase subunit 6/NADH:ubiquinone oxidoreductase subunit I